MIETEIKKLTASIERLADVTEAFGATLVKLDDRLVADTEQQQEAKPATTTKKKAPAKKKAEPKSEGGTEPAELPLIDEEGEETNTPAETPAEPPAEELPAAATLEDARAAVMAVATNVSRGKAAELVEEFGAKKLGEIAADKYPALIARCNALLEEGAGEEADIDDFMAA